MGGEAQLGPGRAGCTVRRLVSEEPRLSLHSRQHRRPRLFGDLVACEEWALSAIPSQEPGEAGLNRLAEARATGCIHLEAAASYLWLEASGTVGC